MQYVGFQVDWLYRIYIRKSYIEIINVIEKEKEYEIENLKSLEITVL